MEVYAVSSVPPYTIPPIHMKVLLSPIIIARPPCAAVQVPLGAVCMEIFSP